MDTVQTLIPPFRSLYYSAFNYFDIFQYLKKNIKFRDDDSAQLRIRKFQAGCVNYSQNKPLLNAQEIPTRVFAFTMCKIWANLAEYKDFEQEAKEVYQMMIDQYIKNKGSTIKDPKFEQMQSMKNLPDRRQKQIITNYNSILSVLIEGASTSKAFKSAYQLLFSLSKHFTNPQILKFHLSQLQDGKNLTPNISISIKSGKQIDEQNKLQKRHPSYLQALKQREAYKILYILDCENDEIQYDNAEIKLKFLKLNGSIDMQIINHVRQNNQSIGRYKVELGILDLSQIQASAQAFASLLSYFVRPQSVQQIKGIIIKNTDLSKVDNNDLTKLFSQFPLEMIVIQNCQITNKQCHGIAHGISLNNNFQPKILRMINITNALKTIDGFGDYLLGQIINSLDFDQILEITMRKVGGKQQMMKALNNLLVNSDSIKIIDIRGNFIPSFENIAINKNSSLCKIDIKDNKRIAFLPCCCLFRCQKFLKRYEIGHDQQLYRRLQNKVNIENFNSEVRKQKILGEQISQGLDEKVQNRYEKIYRQVKKKVSGSIMQQFKKVMKQIARFKRQSIEN